MLRKNIWVMLMVFVFVLSGCSSGDSNVDETTQQMTTVAEATTQAESTTEMTEASSESNDLEGLALLETLNYYQPDHMVIKYKLTSAEGTMNSTYYYSGDNLRMETEIMGYGNQIYIHNADDGVSYQYLEGDTQGIKFADMSEEESEALASGGDMGVNTDLEEITDMGDSNIIARKDMLNGEEVIYVETQESAEGADTYMVKMWFSVKYGIPLKYTVEQGGTVLMTNEVTHISEDSNMDMMLFMPPEDVEFMDFDSNSMFNIQP
jgi:uncharacterized protein YceK